MRLHPRWAGTPTLPEATRSGIGTVSVGPGICVIRRILNRALALAMCPRRSLRCHGSRHRHDLTQPFRVAEMSIGRRVQRRVGGDRLLMESL
ncbi:hypothetical protein JCM18916A_10190 [Cutibacterium acnes subsp. acnes]